MFKLYSYSLTFKEENILSQLSEGFNFCEISDCFKTKSCVLRGVSLIHGEKIYNDDLRKENTQVSRFGDSSVLIKPGRKHCKSVSLLEKFEFPV